MKLSIHPDQATWINPLGELCGVWTYTRKDGTRGRLCRTPGSMAWQAARDGFTNVQPMTRSESDAHTDRMIAAGGIRFK